MDIIDQLVFQDGSIQMSPQEVMLLNAKPPVLYKAPYESTVPDAGYRVFLSGYAQKIVESIRTLSLHKALTQLRAMPRPTQGGYLKKGSVDTRAIITGDYEIQYRIASGQVLVHNVKLVASAQRRKDRLEKPQLYHCRKSGEGVWESEAVTEVSTPLAAVNGQSNNLVKAVWLMGMHVEHAYGGAGVTEYTLYHNPSEGGPSDTWESMRDKFGFTTDVTQKFSQVLSQSQASGKEVKWVAHSQGALIFSEAVRYCLNGNSSWAVAGGFNGMFHKDKGKLLDKHSVTLHGNANNEVRSKRLFDRAGITLIATRSHPYDMVNRIIGMNASNPMQLLGSLVYANHVMNGSVQQSPHTLPYKGYDQWDHAMKNGPGKGRNMGQKAFQKAESSVRYINNYLK